MYDFDSLIEKSEIFKVGKKTTVGVFTLKNGYEFVTYSSCVEESMYDQNKGEKLCISKAKDKIAELEAYSEMKRDVEVKEEYKCCGDCISYIASLNRCSNSFSIHYDSIINPDQRSCNFYNDALPF